MKFTNALLRQSLAIVMICNDDTIDNYECHDDNIALVMFVMSNESNVGLVVSVEFDTSGNDWKLDELALYKVKYYHDIFGTTIATICTNFVLLCMPMFAILLQYISLQSTI